MILVTGGLGYIGSHIVVELLKTHDVIILDNLSNSSLSVLETIKKIICKGKIEFIEGDLRSRVVLNSLFEKYKISNVIHCAGLKSVSESVKIPLEYYDNNVVGTINLLTEMKNAGVSNIIFSSSASVYGTPVYLPIDENHPTKPCSPYAKTKKMIEDILRDFNSEGTVIVLRYFNPVGAHKSGLLFENPHFPNNLVPYVSDVALGKREKVFVYGNDYNTHDRTGVRDYISILDLVDAHIAALNLTEKCFEIINIGTGFGSSVLEVISAYESVCGKTIPYEFAPRRDGDVSYCYTTCKKAKETLNWSAKYNLIDMLTDDWNAKKTQKL